MYQGENSSYIFRGKLIPPWKIRESLFNGQIFEPLKISWIYEFTLQQTNLSHFEGDFPFPKVGYVNSLEGIPYHKGNQSALQVPWSLRSLLLPLVDDAPLTLAPAKGLDFDGGC